MNKTYYFLSGLPRSGSNLLSAILNQNPRFYSGPNSPVISTMVMLENSFSSDELFLAYPKIQQGKQIIASVLPQYYSDRPEPVIFDKNRSWTSRMEYIQGYFDIVPKIICPVRNVNEVLTSFISMIRRNPYPVNGRVNFIDENLIKNNIPITDDNRCEYLLSSFGIVGQSLESIQKALMEGYDRSIHFIEYNDLTKNPKDTLNKLYDFLEEKPYKHNFNEIKSTNEENSAGVYGFLDIHNVRPTIEVVSQDPKKVLSPTILEKCKGLEIWRDLE